MVSNSRLFELHRHGLHRRHHAGPGGVGHVLGDEAHVGHHVLHAQLPGVGRAVDQVLHPLRPVGHRHDTQRLRALGEVPEPGADPAAPEGGDLHAELRRQRPHLGGVVVGPVHGVPADQLAVAEALCRRVREGGPQRLAAAVADDDDYVHTVRLLFNRPPLGRVVNHTTLF